MVRWLWGWLVVVICLSSGVMAAEGGEERRFEIDPPDAPRIMMVRDETSSSSCIGKVHTPSCAVDTLVACFIRYDLHLCHQVIQDFPDLFFSVSRLNSHIEKKKFPYRIKSIRPISQAEQLHPPKPMAYSFTPIIAEPGDYVVNFQVDARGYYETIALLRQVKGEWHVISWFLYFDPIVNADVIENVDGQVWYHISSWNELTSSSCLGQYDSLMCSLQTYMVCEMRTGGIDCSDRKNSTDVVATDWWILTPFILNPLLIDSYRVVDISPTPMRFREKEYNGKPSIDVRVEYSECEFEWNICNKKDPGDVPTVYRLVLIEGVWMPYAYGYD